MSGEWAGKGSTILRLHDGCFHFNKSMSIHMGTQCPKGLGTTMEYFTDLIVDGEIEITFSITNFCVP